MVRRQVHLCLPDLDATQLMPGLLDVLIPGCPLVWLDDSTGKADETRANFKRMYNISERSGGPRMKDVDLDKRIQSVEEDNERGKKQRTFIFSADYRPPTSVRTPARHRASLTQEELAAHAFGPPAKGYDFADRVSAPYYAKPFYEAVSSCSSSASSSVPVLSTSSLSEGSCTSSDYSSPNLPLSPAFTSMSATPVTSVSSHSSNYAGLGHDPKSFSTEADSYFPPQPSPHPLTKSSSPSPIPAPAPLSSASVSSVFPSSPSMFHPLLQSSNAPIYRITTGPGPAQANDMPKRLDRVLERLGKERVTTANGNETESALPCPSMPIEADSLRPSSLSRLSSKQVNQHSHRPRYRSFPPPQIAESSRRRQTQTAAMSATVTLPHPATNVTRERECDDPNFASISGHPDAYASSSSHPSSSSSKTGAKELASHPTMTMSTAGRTTASALTNVKRYVPPPKGTFRSSYAPMLRSEMASIGDISILRQIAELPSSGMTFPISTLVILIHLFPIGSDSTGSGPRAAFPAHPEITLSYRPGLLPEATSDEVAHRPRRNGREFACLVGQGVIDHDVVLSVSEFDVFGAKQLISSTEREMTIPWTRSPAAPPPPKIRRWLRRVRQGKGPEEDWPTAEIKEVADDASASASVYEEASPNIPVTRLESGSRVTSVEPLKMENVMRGGAAQNSDRFVEMRGDSAGNSIDFVSPMAVAGGRSGNSEKEGECVPL